MAEILDLVNDKLCIVGDLNFSLNAGPVKARFVFHRHLFWLIKRFLCGLVPQRTDKA